MVFPCSFSFSQIGQAPGLQNHTTRAIARAPARADRSDRSDRSARSLQVKTPKGDAQLPGPLFGSQRTERKTAPVPKDRLMRGMRASI